MLHLCTRTNQAAVSGRPGSTEGCSPPDPLGNAFFPRNSLILSALLPLHLGCCSLSIWGNSFEFAFPAHWTRTM